MKNEFPLIEFVGAVEAAASLRPQRSLPRVMQIHLGLTRYEVERGSPGYPAVGKFPLALR